MRKVNLLDLRIAYSGFVVVMVYIVFHKHILYFSPLENFDALPLWTKARAHSFLKTRQKRDINEECSEEGSCRHEEAREWLEEHGRSAKNEDVVSS